MATIDQISKLLDEKMGRQSDEFKSELNSIRQDLISKIDKSIKNVDKKIDGINLETETLRNRVTELEDRVSRNERRCQLVMRNIPVVTSENLINIFNDIATAIGFKVVYQPRLLRMRLSSKNPHSSESETLNRNAATSGSRMTRKNSTRQTESSYKAPAIMIHFHSSDERNSFMNLYFKNGNLNLTDIGFETNIRIIIGDNLTPHNYKIFRDAQRLKKLGSLSKVSIRDGLVYVAANSSAKPALVHKLSELNQYTQGTET